MNNIIKKTYVINLKRRDDRWKKINNSFKNININLIRWDAVDGKKLSDKKIKKLTTGFCYNMCSVSMIGCWLSHYKLWKHIVKNKETNVLILEDDAYPTKNINELNKIWKQVPKNWDVIFLGCNGTCEFKITNSLTKWIDKNIYIPKFPLGTHAYMLSYKGAKKLVEDARLKKASYHIDFILSSFILNSKNKELDIYAVYPNLIKQNVDASESDNLDSNSHPLIDYVLSKIPVTEDMKANYLGNTYIINIRKLNLSITYLTTMIYIFFLLIGFYGSYKTIQYTNFITIVIFMIEYLISNKKKQLIFELSSMLLILNFARIIKNYI